MAKMGGKESEWMNKTPAIPSNKLEAGIPLSCCVVAGGFGARWKEGRQKIETNSIYFRNIYKWRKFTSLLVLPPPLRYRMRRQINQTRATLFEPNVYLCKKFFEKSVAFHSRPSFYPPIYAALCFRIIYLKRKHNKHKKRGSPDTRPSFDCYDVRADGFISMFAFFRRAARSEENFKSSRCRRALKIFIQLRRGESAGERKLMGNL